LVAQLPSDRGSAESGALQHAESPTSVCALPSNWVRARDPFVALQLAMRRGLHDIDCTVPLALNERPRKLTARDAVITACDAETIVGQPGATALTISLVQGRLDCVRFLLEQRASLASSCLELPTTESNGDPDATAVELSAVHLACAGSLEVVEYLATVLTPAAFNVSCPNTKMTPLHVACARGRFDIAEYLLRQVGCGGFHDCSATTGHHTAQLPTTVASSGAATPSASLYVAMWRPPPDVPDGSRRARLLAAATLLTSIATAHGLPVVALLVAQEEQTGACVLHHAHPTTLSALLLACIPTVAQEQADGPAGVTLQRSVARNVLELRDSRDRSPLRCAIERDDNEAAELLDIVLEHSARLSEPSALSDNTHAAAAADLIAEHRTDVSDGERTLLHVACDCTHARLRTVLKLAGLARGRCQPESSLVVRGALSAIAAPLARAIALVSYLDVRDRDRGSNVLHLIADHPSHACCDLLAAALQPLVVAVSDAAAAVASASPDDFASDPAAVGHLHSAAIELGDRCRALVSAANTRGTKPTEIAVYNSRAGGLLRVLGTALLGLQAELNLLTVATQPSPGEVKSATPARSANPTQSGRLTAVATTPSPAASSPLLKSLNASGIEDYGLTPNFAHVWRSFEAVTGSWEVLTASNATAAPAVHPASGDSLKPPAGAGAEAKNATGSGLVEAAFTTKALLACCASDLHAAGRAIVDVTTSAAPCPAWLNYLDRQGRSVLHLAVHGGSTVIAEAVLVAARKMAADAAPPPLAPGAVHWTKPADVVASDNLKRWQRFVHQPDSSGQSAREAALSGARGADLWSGTFASEF
jgi:ankyrin repeat protein